MRLPALLSCTTLFLCALLQTADIPVSSTGKNKDGDELEEGKTKEADLPEDIDGEKELTPDEDSEARKQARADPHRTENSVTK